MTCRLDSAKNLSYYALRIDDECIPGGVLLALVLHHASIFARNLRSFVGKKFEVQTFFGAEILVRLAGVETHAQHNCILSLIFCLILLKTVGLKGASLSEIFGIEVKNYPFAPILLQRNRRSILRVQLEIG